jgi:hypothetical protein
MEKARRCAMRSQPEDTEKSLHRLTAASAICLLLGAGMNTAALLAGRLKMPVSGVANATFVIEGDDALYTAAENAASRLLGDALHIPWGEYTVSMSAGDLFLFTGLALLTLLAGKISRAVTQKP